MLKDMISSLLNHGLTQQEISVRTGVAQPAISRIFTGEQKEVGYAAGKAIEALYISETTSKRRACNG
jgi:transcriptional regulator with XRE-family HTH domain